MKLKKIIKQLAGVAIAVTLIGSVPFVYGAENVEIESFDAEIIQELSSDLYEYPLTPDDLEWKKLTVEEKVKVCRIPEMVLEGMSDEALIQAIIDFI